MSEKIVVPVLGESITEATVSKWLKNEPWEKLAPPMMRATSGLLALPLILLPGVISDMTSLGLWPRDLTVAACADPYFRLL